MTLQDGLVLGAEPKLKSDKIKPISEILKPVVRQKFATIDNKCNELVLTF